MIVTPRKSVDDKRCRSGVEMFKVLPPAKIVSELFIELEVENPHVWEPRLGLYHGLEKAQAFFESIACNEKIAAIPQHAERE